MYGWKFLFLTYLGFLGLRDGSALCCDAEARGGVETRRVDSQGFDDHLYLSERDHSRNPCCSSYSAGTDV